MEITKTQRIEITGRAIANRLKHRSLSGEQLNRAIEEVADDMHTANSIAGETLRETLESSRDWNAIKRQTRKTLKAIG